MQQLVLLFQLVQTDLELGLVLEPLCFVLQSLVLYNLLLLKFLLLGGMLDVLLLLLQRLDGALAALLVVEELLLQLVDRPLQRRMLGLLLGQDLLVVVEVVSVSLPVLLPQLLNLLVLLLQPLALQEQLGDLLLQRLSWHWQLLSRRQLDLALEALFLVETCQHFASMHMDL